MVVQYAILWHITLKTQLGSMMTLFTIVGFLPMFFISPFGGVWADRYNRKLITNVSDALIALVSLIVAVLLMMGYTHFSILLVCAGIRSLGQGIQMPAAGAIIPQIVPAEHLTRVNGIQTTIQSICTLAAPMVSGVLMALAPLEILFFLDVLTAIIGISILLFFVSVPNIERIGEEKKGRGYFHDLLEGLRYIRSHELIFKLILFCAIFLIFASPTALLTPLQVIRNFGNDVWRLSAIEIAFSLGMIGGGILIASWGGFRNQRTTMALSCFLLGIVAVGLGVTPNFWLYLGIMAVAGIAIPLFNTPAMVLLQSTVEPEFMGRVLSVFIMVSSSMMPLAMVLFGPAADAVDINLILVGTGIVIALLSTLLVSGRTSREAGNIST
jgi:DHA3 family macrolide efflux protein-like MFS transporter